MQEPAQEAGSAAGQSQRGGARLDAGAISAIAEAEGAAAAAGAWPLDHWPELAARVRFECVYNLGRDQLGLWLPRSYVCSFCRREFRSAQALGGHMNVHRRDRAARRHRQHSPSPPPAHPPPYPHRPSQNSPTIADAAALVSHNTLPPFPVLHPPFHPASPVVVPPGCSCLLADANHITSCSKYDLYETDGLDLELRLG